MIKFYKLYLVLVIILLGCKNKSIVVNENNDQYLNFKNEFSFDLVNHFPRKIKSKENYVISNTNSEKNDVGLYLFEFNISENELKDIKKEILNENPKKYKTKDNCFLIVNRFETVTTKDSLEVVKITDSSLIDKPCYKNLLPIPNFIDYSIFNKTDFWKDVDFDIYVLEAKSGKYFKEFDLLSNPQMPNNWKNGYSKGIAINEKKKTVIYWGIVW